MSELMLRLDKNKAIKGISTAKGCCVDIILLAVSKMMFSEKRTHHYIPSRSHIHTYRFHNELASRVHHD